MNIDQTEKQKLFQYYYDMKRIRMVEEAVAENYYNEIREMHTPIHLYNGQEAVAVGVCSQLENEDIIFSNHRCHGHYLAKGGNLKKMIAELHTKETGCCHGLGGSMHLTDKSAGIAVSSAIVAGNVSIGTGYAMALKQQKSNNIAVVFLGDGATEEGTVYESICFAKLHNLPVLYVCENNLYAISSSLDVREPFSDHVSKKFKNILPTEIIDGNDVEAVSSAVQSVLTQVRYGKGPYFFECMTYRMKDHHNVGTGVELGYRTKQEWDEWNKKSPISRLEEKMYSQKWLNANDVKRIENKIRLEIDNAFTFARKSNLPDEKSFSDYVWGK